jgi:periplasmic protein TonB
MMALSLPLAAPFPPSPQHDQPSRFALNWRRVSAYSGTFSLHFILALALLIPPAAMEIRQIALDPPVYPPAPMPVPPEVKPMPDLPVPPLHQKKVAPSPPIPQITMTMPVPLPTSVPAAPAAATIAPASDAPSAADTRGDSKGAADSAPSALAYLNRTTVNYPSESLRRREQGTVMLRVLVGVDGHPEQIEIDKSSGSRTLDNAARDAVKRWTFSPGMHGGIPYAAWARVPISFTLPL